MRGIKIKELIREADEGRILLPNFQREFTYERKIQKKLICSLLSGIPLGSILLLQGSRTSFASRKIGRKSDQTVGADFTSISYLLDGQQRMSTLWNILTDVYSSRNADREELIGEIHNYLKSRWYVRLRLDDAFSNDIWGLETLSNRGSLRQSMVPDDLSEFVAYSRVQPKGAGWNWGGGLNFPVVNDSSGPSEKEFKKLIDTYWCIPLHVMFDSGQVRKYARHIARRRQIEIQEELRDWKNEMVDYSRFSDREKLFLKEVLSVSGPGDWLSLSLDIVEEQLQERADVWSDAVFEFFVEVAETSIGVVELDDSFLKKAHVVFDAINKSGVKLSSFDLFCASKPGLDVRSIVNTGVPDRMGMKDSGTGLVSDQFTDQLMNLFRVIWSRESDTWSQNVLKSDDIFSMSSTDLSVFLEKAVTSLVQAYTMLHEKCGVRSLSEQAYRLQILPTAYGLYLNDCDKVHRHLQYLYWLGLFGGRYRENQNVRCAKDLEAVYEVVSSGNLDVVEDYRIDGSLWNAVLNLSDYNDVDAMLPAIGAEDFEWRASMEKAVLQFVLSSNPHDFPGGKEGRLTAGETLEKHHVLPLGSAAFDSIEASTAEIRSNKSHFLNSPLNLVYISKESNRKIASMSYEDYSKRMSSVVLKEYGLPVGVGDSFSEAENQIAWLKSRHTELRSSILERLKNLAN